MPTISALDPTTALIVIDLQVGTLAAELAHPTEQITTNALALLAAFRLAGLPVVIAAVDGTPAGRTEYGEGAREFPAEWSSLIPGLAPQPSEILVTRRTWSAFAGTGLEARLKGLGVSQVVLAGVATSFGVESTARDAYDLGFSVSLALDAITDRRIDSHLGSVTRVFPALGQSGSTEDIIALLPVR